MLEKLFSLSLKQGKILYCFKIAKVGPLAKKGDITLMNNLRPISNTTSPSTILEQGTCQPIAQLKSYRSMSKNNFGRN